MPYEPRMNPHYHQGNRGGSLIAEKTPRSNRGSERNHSDDSHEAKGWNSNRGNQRKRRSIRN